MPGRFLFAMFQGGGNIPVIMPIVSRLVARGHDVKVMAGPGIRPSRTPVSEGWLKRINDSGAQRVPFDAPAVHPYDGAPPLSGLAFGWMPARFRHMAATEVRTTLWSPVWATNIAAHLRTNPTDVLVSDFCLFGALAAAEAGGVPHAAIVHNAFHPHAEGLPAKGLGFLPARNLKERVEQAVWQWCYDRIWMRDGVKPLNEVRVELGLPPVASPFDQYDLATRVLILGSRVFDFPARLPSNVRYVGTPIDDAALAGHAWESPWAEDTGEPLVLVSLSTLNQGQGPLLHRILQALEGLPLRAVVTVGPSLDRQEFKAPANAVLETFVPHSAILPHVDAMVTQCGLGTMTKALRNGVPLVCVPVIGEQTDNAVRAEARGTAIRLTSSASSEEIRSALTQILADPRFRDSARALASQMDQRPAEDVACDEIESLAC